MDTHLIQALTTGTFGVVVALVTGIVVPLIRRRLGLDAKESPPKGRSKRKPKRKLSTLLPPGIGGIVGVLLGYFLISPMFVSPCPPFASTRVNISSPVPGSSIPRLVTVQGTACHIPNEKELWLLIVPEGVTSYYPQTGPVVISSDGNWSASAYAGLDDPVDNGRGFMLVAALADQQGSADIRKYFAQQRPQFKGLEPLPQGIQLITQIRVVRR